MSILVGRLRNQFLDAEIDGSILGCIDMLCPCARHYPHYIGRLQINVYQLGHRAVFERVIYETSGGSNAGDVVHDCYLRPLTVMLVAFIYESYNTVLGCLGAQHRSEGITILRPMGC